MYLVYVYFVVPPPKVIKKKSGNAGAASGDHEKDGGKDRATLLLQVEALQNQLREQTKLAKDQMSAMLEDRKVRTEEAETRQSRDEEKVMHLTEKYATVYLYTSKNAYNLCG